MGLNFRRFASGIQIVPRSDGATAPTLQGEFAVSSVDGNLYYNNGSIIEVFTTDIGTLTLKNKTIPITGSGANSITSTPNTAAQFNSISGNLESSVTTATELAFVHGATSNIQAQINALVGSAGITALTGQVTATGPGSSVATIATNTVTNSNLAQMAANTIKGNNTGSLANAADLTVAQVNAILPVFNSTLNGLVPFSGGGTTNFLRADGTWATVSGSGSVTSVALTVPSFLSVSGSPITTSGTLAVSLSGTALPIANGGTGQTTSSAAFGAFSPLTTKGDILGFDTSNDRIPVGTDGQVLTADSTQTLGVKWAAGGSGSPVALNVYLASDYAVTSDNPIIFDTVIFDTNSAYSTITGKYTCPNTGYYQVNATAVSTTSFNLYVRRNSTGGGPVTIGTVGGVINGDANTTGPFSLTGQLFTTSSAGTCTSATVSTALINGGSISGTFVGEIWTNASGVPGTILGTSNAVNISTVTTIAPTYGTTTFTFASGPTLLNSTSYFFVVDGTNVTTSMGNGLFVGYDTSGSGALDGYAGNWTPFTGQVPFVLTGTAGSSTKLNYLGGKDTSNFASGSTIVQASAGNTIEVDSDNTGTIVSSSAPYFSSLSISQIK